jgi:hypothetical protein
LARERRWSSITYDRAVRGILGLLMFAACGKIHFEARAIDGGDSSSDAAGGAGMADASIIDARVCANSCSITMSVDGPYCGGAITVAGNQGFGTIDMTGRTELFVAAFICDSTGYVVHVGDSPSDDGGGGDAKDSSNDAEVYLNGSTFEAWGNDFSPPGARQLENAPGFAPAAGCFDFEMAVRDQEVETTKPAQLVVQSPFLLRINPPMDREGIPDALWHIGLDRTPGGLLRTGSGLVNVSLCW